MKTCKVYGMSYVKGVPTFKDIIVRVEGTKGKESISLADEKSNTMLLVSYQAIEWLIEQLRAEGEE